jgi:anti-sigma factor (TIGR02949 family)
MKMNCTDINQHIDGYLDRELSSLQAQAFDQHVSRCSECTEKVEAERQLRSVLQGMPVPPPSADFKKRVFARVREEYPREPQHHYAMPFATGFASVAVFGLTLWLMGGMQATDPVLEPAQLVTVAVNQSQSVRLVFDADSAIERAELSVDLPDNVRLAGYPGRNKLSWETSLQKGQNVLELPVQVTNEGRGELRTQLSYHNKVKSYQFVVDTQGKNPNKDTQNF